MPLCEKDNHGILCIIVKALWPLHAKLMLCRSVYISNGWWRFCPKITATTTTTTTMTTTRDNNDRNNNLDDSKEIQADFRTHRSILIFILCAILLPRKCCMTSIRYSVHDSHCFVYSRANCITVALLVHIVLCRIYQRIIASSHFQQSDKFNGYLRN